MMQDLAGAADTTLLSNCRVRLVEHARASDGRAVLSRWRSALDTPAWLRAQQVTGVRAQASGVWIEESVALRFLLHLDSGDAQHLTFGSVLRPRDVPGGLPVAGCRLPNMLEIPFTLGKAIRRWHAEDEPLAAALAGAERAAHITTGQGCTPRRSSPPTAYRRLSAGATQYAPALRSTPSAGRTFAGR